MRLATIWDLDGTLVDVRHRLEHILCAKPNWDAYHRLTHMDTLYPHAFKLYKALLQAGVIPVFCTARPERNRHLTKRWLVDNEVPLLGNEFLLMRSDNDHRKSPEIKKDMLTKIRNHYGLSVVMAFEDQPEVVTMYRTEGVPCWAADPENWKRPGAGEENTLKHLSLAK